MCNDVHHQFTHNGVDKQQDVQVPDEALPDRLDNDNGPSINNDNRSSVDNHHRCTGSYNDDSPSDYNDAAGNNNNGASGYNDNCASDDHNGGTFVRWWRDLQQPDWIDE